jgi:hypothetical protein
LRNISSTQRTALSGIHKNNSWTTRSQVFRTRHPFLSHAEENGNDFKELEEGDKIMKRTKMLPSRVAVLRLLVFLGAFAACNDTATSPATILTNAPVTASVTDAFTYVMMASKYTSSVNYDLSFTTDSLVYSLVVSNFGAGNVTYVVVDPSGNTIFRDSVFTSKVNALVQSGKGIPKRCTLGFQNFTGSINLALTANGARH